MSRKPASRADERAALYAVGALSPAEAVAFETAAGRPGSEEGAELRRLDGVTEALAGMCPAARPQPGVRERLLARARADAEARAKGPPPFGQFETPEGVSTVSFQAMPWRETGVQGVRFKVLHLDREANRLTALYEMDAGCTFPDHHHDGTEELFVVQGDMYSGGSWLGPGDYQRAEPGSDHGPAFTRGGCRVLISQPIPAHL